MVSLAVILNFFEEQKSLIIRGEASVNASDIQSFSFNPENQQINAQVCASMKNKIYTVMIRLDEDQTLKEWNCECPKGNDKCHHMAAALIYASKHVSSTDQPCKWNVVREPQELKSCEELFKVQKKNCLKRKPTEEDKNFLFSMLKKHAPESGLMWFMSPEPETDVRACSKQSVDEILNSSSFIEAENKIEYFLSEMALHTEEIAEIFSATEGQKDNPLWGTYRKGRITSSNFGSVLKALNKNNIPPSLLKSLNGEYSLDNVSAIQWGICHEATAIRLFTEIKEKNVVFGGVFLHTSGLLGCSPDGLIGETEILEIKCPFSKCDVDILKEINSKKWYLKSTSATFNATLYESGDTSVYEFKLGDIIFNLQHPLGWKYHHQIQGMLHIMDKNVCHVLIWTPKTSLLFPVTKESGWERNLESLLNFYKNVYIYNFIK